MQHTPDAVTEHLGHRPPKIYAVHLNYPSRAAQRGRTPAQASYFFKPNSSLCGSGDVARPENCELLGFEGEIALVIGTAGRNIATENAAQHIGWVTASNDLGLYDLRYADKGSNVRSKGGDGMTPLGPKLLEAGTLDLKQLRVRTWLDGALVQDDTTADLLFTFEHLIADISRVATLEVGDVILTGTPAGASVAQPGQTIDVEVSDLRDETHTTGKLTTRVVAAPALGATGSQPKVTPATTHDAYGTEPEPVLTDDLRARLSNLAVATVSANLRKRGYAHTSIDGVHPLDPTFKLVGTARTLRYVAHRPDLFAKIGGGYNAQKRAIDSVKPGEVLVMEARGVSEAGTLGDILALRAQVRGAAGIVTDGAARDAGPVAALGLPVFTSGEHPSVLGRYHVPYETDVTITCGGALVMVGDIIFGDRDGCVVIPPSLLEELIIESEAQELQEAFITEMVQAGESVDGLYPLTPKWQPAYEAWLHNHNAKAGRS